MDSIYLLCDTIKNCEPMKIMQEMGIINCNDVYIALIVCVALCIVAIAVSIDVGLWQRRKMNSQMEMEFMRKVWEEMNRKAVEVAKEKAQNNQKDEMDVVRDKFIQYHEKTIQYRDKMLNGFSDVLKEKYKTMDFCELSKEIENIKKIEADLFEEYNKSVNDYKDYIKSNVSVDASDNNK